MSYLSEQQCRSILRTPHFSQPATVSWQDYVLYRGQRQVSVLTCRFNAVPGMTWEFMYRFLCDQLYFYFEPHSVLQVALDYDVLLRNMTVGPTPSYYIWRANSNRYRFQTNLEYEFPLTRDHVRQLTDACATDAMDHVQVNFAHSQVSVQSILAVVCSCMHVGS